MKKIGVLLISFFLLSSLALVLPVQAQKSSQDRGPLSKVTFIHYRKNPAKPAPGGGGKGGATACYSYIASGAKWNTTEDYVVNPTASSLDNNFVFNTVNSGVSEWENYGGSAIFGKGVLDASASAGFNFDNQNTVFFGPYSDNNAIAVTSVWGYFSGSPKLREIVEWDMLFNTFYTWGDADTSSSVMDLQNIATHELGHSAGMGDIYSGSCTAETMFGYSGYGEVSKRDLNSGDILGIKKLYNH